MTAALEKGEAIRFRLAVSGDSVSIVGVREIADSAGARTIPPINPGTGGGRRMLQTGDRVPSVLTLTSQVGKSFQIWDNGGPRNTARERSSNNEHMIIY